MTRFWPHGLPIEVTCDALATPVAVSIQGRRLPVARVVERWRVDEGWWRRRAWREYFQVITAGGQLLLLYHDVRSGLWRLQRLYD
ncbi:MAG: hypothetical protein DIU80_009825 [Chloroflexota bacterium]